MTNGLLRTGLCSAALLAIVLVPVLASTSADARSRRSGSTYEEVQIETQGPVKGYSGSPVGAGISVFCDYQRIPNRQCTITASGQERCKVVSWTLKQYCY